MGKGQAGRLICRRLCSHLPVMAKSGFPAQPEPGPLILNGLTSSNTPKKYILLMTLMNRARKALDRWQNDSGIIAVSISSYQRART